MPLEAKFLGGEGVPTPALIIWISKLPRVKCAKFLGGLRGGWGTPTGGAACCDVVQLAPTLPSAPHLNCHLKEYLLSCITSKSYYNK